jgi:ribosome maturation factor RimP
MKLLSIILLFTYKLLFQMDTTTQSKNVGYHMPVLIYSSNALAPVISQATVELHFGKHLRAYIDKPGGITINDCEVISRSLSDLLDQEDFIDESYILEVSSPGLGRPIKKDKDFQRNLGDEVEVRTYKPINKQKEFVGLLDAWDKESVTLQMESGELFTIARSDIALIREYIEF